MLESAAGRGLSASDTVTVLLLAPADPAAARAGQWTLTDGCRTGISDSPRVAGGRRDAASISESMTESESD